MHKVIFVPEVERKAGRKDFRASCMDVPLCECANHPFQFEQSVNVLTVRAPSQRCPRVAWQAPLLQATVRGDASPHKAVPAFLE